MNRKDQINYEASKNPETLEREIDQQRAEIGSTLHALEQKLSPGELFDKALGFARGNGSEFAHNLGGSIKSHPVSTILLGIGAVGLLLGERRYPAQRGYDSYGYDEYGYDDGFSPYGARTDYAADSDDSSLGDKAAHLKEKARHLKREMASSARQRREQLGASGQRLGSNMRAQAHRAEHSFSRLADEQPLALGAIGIGIGALLGALLPPTQREDQMLGATADRMKAGAADLAQREMATMRHHGEAAGREIRDDIQSRSSQMETSAGRSTATAPGRIGEAGAVATPSSPTDPARGIPPTPLV